MRRIKSFSKLPEEAKAKILNMINALIEECDESYKTMITDYDDSYIYKDDVIYDVKKEFYNEYNAISIDVSCICDDYNFEWKEFKYISAIIGVMISNTPMEDVELPIRVKALLEEFKSKYYNEKR